MLAAEAGVFVLEPHLGKFRDGLFPDLLGVVHIRHTRHEPQYFVAPRTATGPELEAPAGEMVEHGDLLGDLHRVVDRGEGVEDAGAEVDALGGVGEIAEEDVVRGEVGVLLQEVVLGGPGVFEAGPVRLDDVLGLLHQRVMLGLGVGLRPRRRHISLHKEPEFQGSSLLRGAGVAPRKITVRLLTFRRIPQHSPSRLRRYPAPLTIRPARASGALATRERAPRRAVRPPYTRPTPAAHPPRIRCTFDNLTDRQLATRPTLTAPAPTVNT